MSWRERAIERTTDAKAAGRLEIERLAVERLASPTLALDERIFLEAWNILDVTHPAARRKVLVFRLQRVIALPPPRDGEYALRTDARVLEFEEAYRSRHHTQCVWPPEVRALIARARADGASFGFGPKREVPE